MDLEADARGLTQGTIFGLIDFRNMSDLLRLNGSTVSGELVCQDKMLRQRMRSAPWGQGVKVRLLVIIDEAHVGIPEDGSHMRAVEARYGAEHTQVPFTATPKVENLLAHGLSLPDNRRGRQHHTEPHRSNAMGTLLAPSPPAIPQGHGTSNLGIRPIGNKRMVGNDTGAMTLAVPSAMRWRRRLKFFF